MPAENQSWDALNRKIIACRKCPRLVAWREEVARATNQISPSQHLGNPQCLR